MAYTVTYKRRTKTGKMSTVKRRVAGNRPSPSPGTTSAPRAKKPAGRKGNITSAKRPSASPKQFKAPAPRKKSPTVKRSTQLKTRSSQSKMPPVIGVGDKFPAKSEYLGMITGRKTPGERLLGGGRDTNTATAYVHMSRSGKILVRTRFVKKYGKNPDAFTRKDAIAGLRRGSQEIAFGAPSIFLKNEMQTRAFRGITPTAKEISLRSQLRYKNTRFSTFEQAVISGAAQILPKNTFQKALESDLRRKLRRGKRTDVRNMSVIKAFLSGGK